MGILGGADVAWLSDELGQPGRVARVLTARARKDLTVGAAGMIIFGLLGWAAGLATAIVISGAAMAALGLFVAARFTEDNFTPPSTGGARHCRSSGRAPLSSAAITRSCSCSPPQ
jgi:hypothetical protein